MSVKTVDNRKQISHWMDPNQPLDGSRYPNAQTNSDWLRLERDRLMLTGPVGCRRMVDIIQNPMNSFEYALFYRHGYYDSECGEWITVVSTRQVDEA